MPTLRRPARLAVVACLAVAGLAGLAPSPARALEPPRPLPAHRPAFVTETDTRPWTDCLWASASMLLDKWTNGDVRVTHQRLRRLSGDLHGGSSLEDMQTAFRRLGFRFSLGPGGDSTMTWGGLLARLRKGAGAVVLGDYGQLPRWYGRWDVRFWRGKGKQGNDDHALYVERYDARRGRVWVMDPLGRGGYRGEWMSIWSLQRFAWFAGGRVQAVATPTARPAPFKGVRVGGPAVTRSTGELQAAWTLRAPRRWRVPGADAHGSVQRLTDPLGAAAVAAAAAADGRAGSAVQTGDAGSGASAKPRARVTSRMLQASIALPRDPGAYAVSLRVTDRRFGQRVADAGPVLAFVPGERRASLYLRPAEGSQAAGTTMGVFLSVTNSGSVTWVDPEKRGGSGRELPRATRVEATWIRLDQPAGAAARAGGGSPPRATSVLRPIELGPGHTARFEASVVVPVLPGRWALVVDVVDDVDGSFAALGSEPAVSIVEVLGPSAARASTLEAVQAAIR